MIPTHPVLSTLSPTRRAVLDALKKRGHLDAETLADLVGISASAMRQQLTALARDGLVEYEEIRNGPGRPRHRYRLTAAGDGLYPRTYAEVTNEILEFIEGESPEMLEAVFAHRRQRRIDNATDRMAGKDLEAKIHELTRILDEDGYVAEATRNDDGTFTIAEYNCAIFGIAMKYGQACGSEIEFIREVLPGTTVERTSHMVQGAHRCAYLVTPDDPA